MSDWTHITGPTLRQLYAMSAMQGDWGSSKSIGRSCEYAKAAEEYFKMADAMIEYELREQELMDEES